jgi:hypothetical protein
VIAVLITLSVVLTASVMFPAITASAIFAIMAGCAAVAVTGGGFALARARRAARAAALAEAAVLTEVAEMAEAAEAAADGAPAPVDKLSWRMPPLSELPAPAIRGARRIGLLGLRCYLAIAMIMVIVKVIETALGH